MEKFKIISSSSIEKLNQKINTYIEDGWIPVGSHKVVITNTINKFSGDQIRESENVIEYSIFMKKNE